MILNEEIAEFREILDHYNTALEYHHQRGKLHHQALVLICIAQLYFPAAHKLRPAALLAFFKTLDSAEDIDQRMREGWKYLRGWNKVEKLLLASEEQMRLLIFPLATHICCQFPVSLHELRNEHIWSTMQGAKSVGLG